MGRFLFSGKRSSRWGFIGKIRIRLPLFAHFDLFHEFPALSQFAVKRTIKAREFEYCVSLKEDIYKMIDMFFDIQRTGTLEDSGSIEDILGKLEPGDEPYEEEIEGMEKT